MECASRTLCAEGPDHQLWKRLVAGTGRSVKLIPTEEKLLFELSVHAGRALTNDQLMRQVLAQRQPGDPQVVRAYVGRLSGRPRDHAYSPDYTFNESRVDYRMAKGETQEREEP